MHFEWDNKSTGNVHIKKIKYQKHINTIIWTINFSYGKKVFMRGLFHI